MVVNASSISISVASPKSVVPHSHHPPVEPISLIPKTNTNGNVHTTEQRQGMNIVQAGGNTTDAWVCPASEKANRTTNPIRAIVDPIVSKIKLGCQRGDGKDPISLAVSCYNVQIWMISRLLAMSLSCHYFFLLRFKLKHHC